MRSDLAFLHYNSWYGILLLYQHYGLKRDQSRTDLWLALEADLDDISVLLNLLPRDFKGQRETWLQRDQDPLYAELNF